VAEPLRRPERLDVTFEARVMSAVQAEVRAGHQPGRRARFAVLDWWLRPRVLNITPVAGLGMAAVSVMFVLLGAWTVQSIMKNDTEGSRMRSAAAVDTVHLVRFVFMDPTARSVWLVGDFNGWQKGATRLVAAGSGGGAWITTIALPAGRHEYAFVIEGPNGERWAVDPFAATVHDEFETESSVIQLGGEISAQPVSS
jgi:hypothetical protein